MRFVPGKVYRSITGLELLCIAETEWINMARRTMYYIILRPTEGDINYGKVKKWDYSPYDVMSYPEVEE